MGDTQTTQAAETTRVKQKMEDRPPHEREYAPRACAEATLFRAAAGDDPRTPPQHMARVLRRLTAPQQTSFLLQCQRHYGNTYVQRMVSSLDKGQPSVLKKDGDGAPPREHSLFDVQMPQGQGNPLPSNHRQAFEQTLNHPLDHVRIHTGTNEHQVARQINAEAFTVGSNIYFANGNYSPGTLTGDETLAHELTHVVQNDKGRVPHVSAREQIISQPTDPLEQEAYAQEHTIVQKAGQIAHQVLNTPDAVATASAERAPSFGGAPNQTLQTKPLAASITPIVQRQKENDEEEDNPIQAKSAGALSDTFEAGAEVETQVSLGKGRGSPLPDPVRAYMEPRFGVDFGQVRVHTGSDALQMTQAVGAQAFTHGSDIYFGEGQSPTNLELTAHELTHVVQQTGGVPLQTKKREEEGAPPSPEPSIQRICAACAAGDKEKKGSGPHLARVRQTLTAAQIQGKWNFAGVKQYSGGGEGDSTSGNGSIGLSSILAAGLYSSALADAYTEQKRGFLKSSYGGRAKAFRWITSEYRFKNDHDGAAFLHLSGKATISGYAKAEDLQYARGAALIVGRITENPARTRTSAELFTPLKEGGISAASVEKDQGQIEAEVPVGDGKVNITIPLTKVKEGTQVPINDVNSPSYNVPNSVDEVDITIIVRADADADIEDEVWGGLLAAGDENNAHVVASFLLDWNSRPESGASVPSVTPPGSPPAIASDPCSEDNMRKLIGNRSVAEVISDSTPGDKINGKRVKPNQDLVEKNLVVKYASQECNGSPFPAIDLYPGKDYTVIDEGHHRFVASRLRNKQISISGTHRPIDYDPEKGNFPDPFEWKEVNWQ